MNLKKYLILKNLKKWQIVKSVILIYGEKIGEIDINYKKWYNKIDNGKLLEIIGHKAIGLRIKKIYGS